MKAQHKTKAIKMIEKFDKQLRDILSEELKTVKETRKHIMARLNSNNDGLLVA